MAYTPQYTHNLLHEAHMKHRLIQLQVAKVTRTLGNIARAGLTARIAIGRTLARVQQTAKLGLARFRGLRVLYATITGDRHAFLFIFFFFVFLFSIRRKKTLNIKIKLSRQTYNLLGTEYAELYSLDVTIGRRRIGYARVYERHICSLSLSD